jgi:hypothetical protein
MILFIAVELTKITLNISTVLRTITEIHIKYISKHVISLTSNNTKNHKFAMN